MIDENDDELYAQAVATVREHHRATIAHVQRRLIIGYNRAARLVERMEAEGVISKPNVQGMRTVLPAKD